VPEPCAHELIFVVWHAAIVEHVRDGSTVRVRLFLPEGDHQFVTVAMAGVRTPRVSVKQGEPSEQWGEEVTRIYAIFFLFQDIDT
jgi:endonuclease YncB( thermonuclease family)